MVDNIIDFPMLGYRILEGVGLGYRLEWFDELGNEWMFVMDSIDLTECITAMRKDIEYGNEDKYGKNE